MEHSRNQPAHRPHLSLSVYPALSPSQTEETRWHNEIKSLFWCEKADSECVWRHRQRPCAQVSCSDCGTARSWSVETGRLLYNKKPHSGFHFHGFVPPAPPLSHRFSPRPGHAGYCKFLRILRNPGNLHATRCVPGVFPLQRRTLKRYDRDPLS